MTIIEGGEYVLGKKKFPAVSERYQPSNIVVACLAEYIKAVYPWISDELELINSPKLFYKQHPEIPHFPLKLDPNASSPFKIEDSQIVTNLPATEFCKTFYDEVFYCMKVGSPTTVLSSRQLFHLRKYHSIFCGDWTWFPKVYPAEVFEELCSENYLPSGVTPQEVIASLFDVDYNVLTDTDRCVPVSDGTYRLYLPSEDAVISIPKSLKERLSYENMCDIAFDGSYVTLHGKPLHTYIEDCCGVYLTGNSFNLVQCL